MPSAERGEQARNENGHSEGDLRVSMRQSHARLANAQAVLKRRIQAVEQAEHERNVRFSKAIMKKEANQAADGLNISNIDELRKIQRAPPPIVELVARCVSTLISGDNIGYEAYEEERPRSRSASPNPEDEGPVSARAKQVASAERLSTTKSPRGPGAHDSVPMSARGERPSSPRPMSARGERPSSPRLISARGERPSSPRPRSARMTAPRRRRSGRAVWRRRRSGARASA